IGEVLFFGRDQDFNCFAAQDMLFSYKLKQGTVTKCAVLLHIYPLVQWFDINSGFTCSCRIVGGISVHMSSMILKGLLLLSTPTIKTVMKKDVDSSCEEVAQDDKRQLSTLKRPRATGSRFGYVGYKEKLDDPFRDCRRSSSWHARLLNAEKETMPMAAKCAVFLFTSILLSSGLIAAVASPAPAAARIVGEIAVNMAFTLFKWLKSFSSPTAKAGDFRVLGNSVTAYVKCVFGLRVSGVTSRSLIKFEGGYNIKPLFEGNRLGIDPYSVHATPTGDLLILDSTNSNLYKLQIPATDSRPRILLGSSQGHSGHVDGKLREARMHHPRGMTVDNKGNIYIADTDNMAIRKIRDAGVTTIAGGKQNGRSHLDGPSVEAILSDDFDVVYVASSCSLLIIDRGYKAIREIQLDYDDCPSQSSHQDGDFQFLGNICASNSTFLVFSMCHLYNVVDVTGIAALTAAGFFGYMLALLVQRVRALFSSRREPRILQLKSSAIAAPYQRLPRPAMPPPLANEDEPVKPEEGILSSFLRLIFNTVSSMAEILAAIIFWGFRKKQYRPNLQQLHRYDHYQHQQPRRHVDTWPSQASYIMDDEVESPFAPSVRSPTPRNKPTDTFMKDTGNNEQFRQRRTQHQQHPIQHQQGQQRQQEQQIVEREEKMQHQKQKRERTIQRHDPASPKVAKGFEPNGAETSEVVFGAVQEQDGRHEAVVIKAVEHNDPNSQKHHNARSCFNYMGY
ncbi:hypothetical protein AKJ16_DCAP04498, partial [Drosera capensis]